MKPAVLEQQSNRLRYASGGTIKGLPVDPSDDELARDWTLDAKDLVEVEHCRGDANRRRFAVQLCALRNAGRFLDDYQSVSLKIINHLSRQLELSPVLFLSGSERTATESAHRARLQKYLGFADFIAQIKEKLAEWLRSRAMEGVPVGELIKRAEGWLFSERVVLPSRTDLERLVIDSISNVSTSVFSQISDLLPAGFGKELDRLLDTGAASPRSVLFYLKEYPPAAKTKSILDYLGRYKIVRSFVEKNIELDEIEPGIIKHLAFLCKRFDAYTLRRFADDKRRALLACFLIETEKTLLDHLVEMHDQFLIEMTRHARSAYEKKSRDLRRRARAGMETVLCAVEDLLITNGDSVAEDAVAEGHNPLRKTENNLRQKIRFSQLNKYQTIRSPQPDIAANFFARFKKNELREAVTACREWTRLEDRGLVDEILARYTGLRRYLIEFLQLPFAAERGGEPILESIKILREKEGKRIRDLPADVSISFVPAAWRKSLYDDNDCIDQKLWMIALAMAVRDALRAGALFLPNSRRHVSFWNLIYSEQQWQVEREESYNELALTSEPNELSANLKEEFQEAVRGFIKSLNNNDFAVIRDGKLKLKRDDALIESEESKQLRHAIEAALPRIRIEDLLLAVDAECDFTRELRPLQSNNFRAMRTSRLRQTKLAALIAHGTNLGISAMGHSTEEITVEMLQTVSKLHLNESTIKAANAVLVNFHNRLSMSHAWGEGTTSSSDGQRFVVQESSLVASYYPRYFGYYERGVSLYTHVSDQHSVFSTQVISCGPREALYVLDGLLENDTILRPREHYTDTAGYTEQLFGLCYLLGFQFSPRIKDIKDVQLYKIERTGQLGKLQTLFSAAVDWNLINEQYDQLVRVAASLKNRTAPAHVVLQRLINSAPSDRLAKALLNLGRIVKTIYILRYLSDEKLRRRVQRQLNRGESRHNLARWLFFANRGEFRQGDYEEIMNKASCLSLLSNAVLVWNTLEIGKIVNQLRMGGEQIAVQDLAGISPLLFQHVIPNGTYRFHEKN